MPNRHDYSETAKPSDFSKGQIVWTHPATDRFMMGDASGIVQLIGRKYVTVRMTRSGQLCRFSPSNLASDSVF